MKRLLLVLLIVFLLVVTGCEDNSTEPEDQDVIVPETTEVIGSDVAEEEIESISETGDFTVDENSELADLEVGHVMLGGISDVASEGFLRKITSKRTENGKVILETEQASMAEAIEEMQLSETIQLTPADVQRMELFNNSKYKSKRDDLEFSFDLNAVFYDQDGNNSTTNDQIRIEGDMNFLLDFFLDIDISWFSLKSIESGIETEKTMSLDLIADLHWEFEEESSFDIAEMGFTPITFTVGIIPVIVTPELKIEAHINGDLTVTITTGISFEETTRNGIGYADNDWYEIKESEKSYTYNPPTLQTEFNFETGASLKFGLYLYGAAGPYTRAKTGLHFSADMLVNQGGAVLNMDLEAILYAICGVYMEALDITLVDEYMEYIIYTHPVGNWTFDIEETNPPNPPVSPNPSHNSENISINAGLTWNCNDPDGDALTYDVYWGTDSTPDSGELVSENQSSTTYDPGTMEYETTYYWKIVASDGEYETEGDVWQFTTETEGTINHAPDEPYNPSPSDNVENVSMNYNLSWMGSDPDGDDLTYDVYWGTDSTPDSGELVSENQSSTTYDPGTMEYETTYYWKIVASDGEYETEGDVWQFTTSSESNAGSIIVINPNSSTIWQQGSDLNIEWDESSVSGNQIQALIYKNDTEVGVCHDWTANDGICHGWVENDWGTGSGYQLKLIDHDNNFGWSEYFNITGNGGSVLNENFDSWNSSVWEGNRWSCNINYGNWQPDVSDGQAQMITNDTDWGIIRSIDAIKVESQSTITLTPYLESGGTNADRAAIGFTNNWIHYGSNLGAGLTFFDGEVTVWIEDYTSIVWDIESLGSYTPGEQVTVIFIWNQDGSLTINYGSNSYTISQNDMPLTSGNILIGVINSSDGFNVDNVTVN